MARQGVGIALQGEIDQPQYLLRQAEKRRKKRQNRLANAKQEQAKIAESLQTLDKKIHPIYDTKVKEITTELKDKAQKLRTEYQQQYGDRGRYLYTKDPRYSDLVTQTKRKLNNYVNSTEQIKDYQEKLSQEGVVGHNGVGDALRQNDFQKFKEVVGNDQGYFNLAPINQSDFGKIANDIKEQVGYTDAYATTVKGKNDQLQKITKSKLNKEEFQQAVANKWASDSELRKYAQNRGVNDFETFYEVIEGQVPDEKVERGLKNEPSDDDSGGGGGGYYGDNQGIFTFMSSEYEKINQQSSSSDEEVDNLDKWQSLGRAVRLPKIEPKERDAAMGAVEAYDINAAADGQFLALQTDQIYRKKQNSEDFEAIAGQGEEKVAPIRAKDFKVVPIYYTRDNEVKIAQTREEIRNNAVQPAAITEVEPYQGELSQQYLKEGRKQYENRKNNNESSNFAVIPLSEAGNALALDKELGQLSLDPDDSRSSNNPPQQTEPQPDQQTESQSGDGDKPFSEQGVGDSLFN